LYTGIEPFLPFVFRTAETPAGLKISTVVKTFRDREVPPALPFCEGTSNIQSGTAKDELVAVPRLQRTAALSFVLNSMSIGRAALRPGHTLLRGRRSHLSEIRL
jgi:hypothetical protein